MPAVDAEYIVTIFIVSLESFGPLLAVVAPPVLGLLVISAVVLLFWRLIDAWR